jgi:hypothetical protein
VLSQRDAENQGKEASGEEVLRSSTPVLPTLRATTASPAQTQTASAGQRESLRTFRNVTRRSVDSMAADSPGFKENSRPRGTSAEGATGLDEQPIAPRTMKQTVVLPTKGSSSLEAQDADARASTRPAMAE